MESEGLGEDSRHNSFFAKFHRWASEPILTQSTLNDDDDEERRMGQYNINKSINNTK